MTRQHTDPQDTALAITGTPQEAMGQAEQYRALDARMFQEADAERDRHLGACVREAITSAYNAEIAEAVRVALVQPTRPGTPSRVLQDHLFRVLLPRLDKIVQQVTR